MDRLRGWSEHIIMPGQEPDDPDPLTVWWVSSEDRRLALTMAEAWLEELYFDEASAEEADFPEVSALLGDLTYVAVRDIWIENDVRK